MKLQLRAAPALVRAAPRGCSVAPAVTLDPDAELLARLRRGDERAFRTLVERHHSAMLRVALWHVRDRQAAEEVVQETWLAVIQGLDRFEGRSTLKTWLFRILTNRAKTRGEREARSVPFSAVVDSDDDEPASPPIASKAPTATTPATGRRRPPPGRRSRTCGCSRRRPCATSPTRSSGCRLSQRSVIRLRDIEGWDADEVCDLLGLSHGNQRVLLHRARAKVRSALERYLADEVISA